MRPHEPARTTPGARSSARKSRQLGAVIAVAAALLAGYGAEYAPATAEPVPVPAADPFYASPAALGSFTNGAVLQSRAITPFGLAGLPINTWQVQYKSLDAGGAPTTGVATIVVPSTPWAGPGARPLVSYQVAEDSLGQQCAPSYSIRAGIGAGINNSNSEAPVITTLLQRNWAVVLPDYQGSQSRFLDGMQAAHSTLDGIRAARAFVPAGLAGSPIGALGYSGGAFATAWTAEQQPAYAPELRFTGVAMGGVPANALHALQAISGTYAAGLGMLGLAALDRLAPDDLPSLLNDRGRSMVAQNNSSCGTDFITKYMFANFDDYTTVPDIADNPRLSAVSRQLRLDRAIPAGPTYVWHSTGDDVLPVSDTDRLVRSWCAAGAHVTYVHTSTPTHAAAALTGLPAAADYLAQRFAGTPAPDGCA